MLSLFKQHFGIYEERMRAMSCNWNGSFVVIVIYSAELLFYDTNTAFSTEALCKMILSNETISHFDFTISKMAKLFLKWRQSNTRGCARKTRTFQIFRKVRHQTFLFFANC